MKEFVSSGYCADCGMPQPLDGVHELHLSDCVQHKEKICVVCLDPNVNIDDVFFERIYADANRSSHKTV